MKGPGAPCDVGSNLARGKIPSSNTGRLKDLSSSGINYDPMKDLYVIGQVPEPVTSLPFGPRKEGQFQVVAKWASVPDLVTSFLLVSGTCNSIAR